MKTNIIRLLGFCLAAALLGVGAEGIVRRLNDSSSELQRPDLLIAFGVCVLVYLGSSEHEEAQTLPEP